MHRSARLAAALIVPLVGACAAVQAVTHACTFDGQPTAVANGRRALPTRATGTAATVRTWAPFSFPGSYHARTVVQLSEDQARLHAALPPEAFGRPWSWQFGDGDRAVGWRVAHRYSHPGRYRIVVAAYYPIWHSAVAFDAVRIAIAP